MKTWSCKDVHHVGITVSDIERSILFYRDLLGMQLVARRPCVEEGYVAEQTGYEEVKLSVASFRVRPDSPNSLEVVQYLNHTAQPASTSTTNLAGPTCVSSLMISPRPTRRCPPKVCAFARPPSRSRRVRTRGEESSICTTRMTTCSRCFSPPSDLRDRHLRAGSRLMTSTRLPWHPATPPCLLRQATSFTSPQ